MAIPIHDLWWLAAGGGASAGARFMKVRIDAALKARRRSRLPDPTGELLRLQTLYGYNPHSLVSIAPGALLWSTPEIDGAIIYGEFGRVWLAAGDPLAPLEDMAELARLAALGDDLWLAGRARSVSAFRVQEVFCGSRPRKARRLSRRQSDSGAQSLVSGRRLARARRAARAFHFAGYGSARKVESRGRLAGNVGDLAAGDLWP